MAAGSATLDKYYWGKDTTAAAYGPSRCIQYNKGDVKLKATLHVQVMDDSVDESGFTHYVEMLIWNEDCLYENGNGATQIIISSSGEKISPYIFNDESDANRKMIDQSEYKLFSEADNAILAAEEWLNELLKSEGAALGKDWCS